MNRIGNGSRSHRGAMLIKDGSSSFLMTDTRAVDYDVFPLPSGERLLILDENGVLREAYATDVSYLISQNVSALSDDFEIPSHVLDHMYAKKPREPGSEQTVVKTRRRTKKKEKTVEQLLVSESQPSSPKINIIRQRLPTAVYKSLTARPKILHGSPVIGAHKNQNYGHKSSLTVSPNNNLSSSSSTPNSKTKPLPASPPVKQGSHSRVNKKKEDPPKTMYASFDEVTKPFFTSKGTKDKDSSKSQKQSNSWKKQTNSSNSCAITTMDDLHRVGASYDEDILFDFGIAEDDDEAIACALNTDVFSDGELDEFSVGMESVYNQQHSQFKSSQLSKSPPPGMTCNPRSILRHSTSTPLSLSSDILDDDDSNEIMVSMRGNSSIINGRQHSSISQDWDAAVQMFENDNDNAMNITLNGKEETINHPSSVLSLGSGAGDDDLDAVKPSLSMECDIKSELDDEEDSSGLSITTFKALAPNRVPNLDLPTEELLSQGNEYENDRDVLVSSTRRSSRVVKTPAWLEDGDKFILSNKRARK